MWQWNKSLCLAGLLISCNFLMAAVPLEEISFSELESGGEYTEVSKSLGGTVGLVHDTDSVEQTSTPEKKTLIKPQRPLSTGSLLDSALPPLPVMLPGKKPGADNKNDIEPGELVFASTDMTSARAMAARLKINGFHLKRRILLSELDFVLSVIQVPSGRTVEQYLQTLREQYPGMWVDYNRRYLLQGGTIQKQDLNQKAKALSDWPENPDCGAAQRIGMIDTAVDAQLAGLDDRIEQKNLLTYGVESADKTHGTAVAALLAGKTFGLLPGVHLYVAAVFRRSKEGLPANTNTELILKALNWLVKKNIPVINFSLGGRQNLLVDLALQKVLAKGIAVVAAAGNSGAGKPPIYPAAQTGVIAVTAVDITGLPYSRANTGDYLDFAAPGVDLALPSERGIVYRSGTSYSTPFVSAAILLEISKGENVLSAYQNLAQQAEDRPPQGKDSQYGWGILKITGCDTEKN